jgi:superfamily II DNA or RNA helicase
MISLRPYQQIFYNNIRAKLHLKQIIACSATGSGKTKTFLKIANDALVKQTTVLILTESRKIFGQIALEQPSAIEIKAEVKFINIGAGKLYVAMAQTLVNRPNIIAQLQYFGPQLLIICDEAHVGTPTKLLLQLPDAYLIGFTATPDYKVAKHLPVLYKDIVVGPQPQELVELGYLAPYYHYEMHSVDLSGLQKKGGEFTEQSQFAIFDKPKVFTGLHADLKKYAFKKAIIFCSSIKHAARLTEELREAGYNVAEVHSGNTNSDIELASFVHGTTPICCSVGILTKGFDFPAIDLIILQRATTSLALYCQMIGRGSRTYIGKTRFTVLDYGGNASRHGLWNFEHDWSEKWNGKEKKKKEGVAPVKECPSCFLLVAVSAMICPECGHKWETKERAASEGEMKDVTAEYNILRGKYIGDLTPIELFTYAKIVNKKAFAKRVATAKGNEYLQEYATACGWKNGWQHHIVADAAIEFYNIKIK